MLSVALFQHTDVDGVWTCMGVWALVPGCVCCVCMCVMWTDIVGKAEAIVIERFGKFHKVLNSGIHFVIPFMDSPRSFSWRRTHIDVSGHVVNETTHGFRIDMRESVFNFPTQEAFTKETVRLRVNALMYHRIFDVSKALYEVDDLSAALGNTAQSHIKELVGSLRFSQCLDAQDRMNEYLAAEFSKIFSQWGIVVERMEILELEAMSSIADAMKKQMVAERDRRGDFIRSEGNKAALRLRAEGDKIVSVNIGLAEQEAKRKRSEGTATAKIQLARAESQALDTVASAIQVNPTGYMVAQKYMGILSSVLTSPSSTTLYLPYVAEGLTGTVASLPALYGADATPAPTVPRPARPTRHSSATPGASSSSSRPSAVAHGKLPLLDPDDDDDAASSSLRYPGDDLHDDGSARIIAPPLPTPTPTSPARSSRSARSAAGVGVLDDFDDLN